MEQKNVRKYLLYAVGEVLLVVVGILIALQVNNWNEQQKRLSQSEAYHLRLLDDTDALITDLEQYRVFAESTFESAVTTLEILQRGEATSSERVMMDSFFQRYFKFSLSLENFNTFEEMQSTGTLDLIRDPELKRRLASLVDAKTFFIEAHRTFTDSALRDSATFDRYVLYRFSDEVPGAPIRSVAYDLDRMAADGDLQRTISRIAMLFSASIELHQSFLDEAREVRQRLDDVYETLAESR